MSDSPRNRYIEFAQKRLLDLVALRDHSESELRAKLWQHLKKFSKKSGPQSRTPWGSSGRASSVDTVPSDGAEFDLAPADTEPQILEAIDQAIYYAKERHWLGAPAALAAKLAEGLHRKNKGIEYINHYLENKGLPPVTQESEMELEKARALVKNKYSDFQELSPDEQTKVEARVARMLASRGFSSEVVRKVLYEKFRD